MITFHLDRIRYAYPIDRIPDPEVNPPQPPAATQPAQHTLVTYGIVFSAGHYPAALNPRDYIRPVHDATLTLAPTTLDVFSARPGLTCYWPSPTAPPIAIPAIEVRASATLPYGRLDHDATRRLFAELVIPRLDQAISNHNPT